MTSVKTPVPMTVIKMPSVKTMWDHLNVLVRKGSQEMEKHAKVIITINYKFTFDYSAFEQKTMSNGEA